MDASEVGAGELTSILPLIGERAYPLHPPRSIGGATGGGDLDCVVSGLDARWPLRLPAGWRFLQCIRYGITGWYWVLEHEGRVMALDTLDDPRGIGRLGFPTELALGRPGGPPPAVRAAFLTTKRLSKGMREHARWDHIRGLAQDDPETYLRVLQHMFGSGASQGLVGPVERGQPPETDLWRRARRALWIRRARNPSRALAIAIRSVARVAERVTRPNGLYVVVAGPDGAGKSSLAAALPEACTGPFWKTARFHWSPQVLPRLGALLGRHIADTTRPHVRPQHGHVVSLAALAYYWLDFLLGSWLRIWPVRARSGLVVLERGWWDIAVDPRRYRMRVPQAVVGALGRLLPRPDVILVLEAQPAVLLERKHELPEAELARQGQAWHEVVPRRARPVYLDASRPPEEVVRTARDTIFDLAEARALAHLKGGWAGLPRRRSPRWILPRTPRRAARSALSIYQPVTLRGRAGWEAARLASEVGALRLLPRGPAPPREVREALAPHLPPGATVAVMSANHPGRYVALVIGPDGATQAVGKVATDERGRGALDRETLALTTLGPRLPPPLSSPALLAQDEGLLLLEMIPWRPRLRPWRLPEEVAFALGLFFRATAGENPGTGASHGDCAPWNVLRSGDRWILIDWEQARDDAPPFFDVFHYILQSHVLLRRRPPRALLDDLATRRGPVGAAVKAYADGAGIPSGTAVDFLPAYLEESSRGLDPESRSGRAGLRARRELLRALAREDG
ncbi:MAG: hypothetical protein ACREA0_00140 [bacterium]